MILNSHYWIHLPVKWPSVCPQGKVWLIIWVTDLIGLSWNAKPCWTRMNAITDDLQHCRKIKGHNTSGKIKCLHELSVSRAERKWLQILFRLAFVHVHFWKICRHLYSRLEMYWGFCLKVLVLYFQQTSKLLRLDCLGVYQCSLGK